jgi:hypothetical protein
VDCHGSAPAAAQTHAHESAASPIRPIISPHFVPERKNTRTRRVSFHFNSLRKVYGERFGLAAGEVVVVVVVAGLVAGFSVVVVAGFLFSAVMISVVKSKLSLE